MALSWANALNQRTKKEGSDFQKMVLGLEILLHNIPKLILMVVLSAVLGILMQTFIIWIPFAIVRRYASGLHAQNGITCTIMTLLMFVAVPYFAYGHYEHSK